MFGTFCVLAVNAWMNSPTGFRIERGRVVDVDPLRAMFNDAVWLQFLHMWIATFLVVGFSVASVYAVGILRGRDDPHHRLGFIVPFAFASVAALLQPISGHLAGMRLAEAQPTKLASMELATRSEARAPLIIGGVLIDGEVRYGIEIPVIGSVIARSDPNGVVPGLRDSDPESRPTDGLATMVHWSFQSMIAIGFALLGLSGWYWWARSVGGVTSSRRAVSCAAVSVSGAAAIAALELGWITTEVGRQPWIAYGVMRIKDAVALDNQVWVSFVVLVVVYVAMIGGAAMVLRSMARRWRDGESLDLPTPYSPGHRS